jgi:hypothetical protein
VWSGGDPQSLTVRSKPDPLLLGQARGVSTGLVAHVTNAIDHDGEPFHKGPENADVAILKAIAYIALS